MAGMLIASALVFVLAPALPAQTPAKPVKATPENAAAFVGDWDLAGEGPRGPVSFALSIKVDGQTLTAALKRDDVLQSVTDVSMVGSSLMLQVTFSSDAGEYPASVGLTPSGDKVSLMIDAGVAQVNGTATKKIKKT